MKKKILPPSQIAGPIALIIRHAERDPIVNMVNALEAQLTAQGKTDSYNLGKMIANYCPIKIYHSPVPRCRQTAECIFEGITSIDQRANIAGYLLDLGGPYIIGNWDAIVASIKKMGQTQFIRRWFDNQLPSDLIMSLHEAAIIQIKILLNQLTSTKSSSINITHDWNIMILREYYFKLQHEEIGDPDYLDGLYAFLSDGNLILQYHEHETIIDSSSIIM